MEEEKKSPISYTLCLFESRPHDNLGEVLNRHLKFLPTPGNIIVWCNKTLFIDDYIVFLINNSLEHCRVQCIEIPTLDSTNDYNYMLTSFAFWQVFKTSHVLIIHTDSEILRPGLEEFYEYDYVGAPWKFQLHGGNGGFSWRNVDVMKSIIKSHPYDIRKHGNEDLYFCNVMNKFNMNLAPREVCENFSCESIYRLNTFGAHAIDKYLTKEQCNKIRSC